MERFYGDLWNASRETVETAARRIMEGRGYGVRRVHNLTSGLYVSVEIEGRNGGCVPGSTVNIGADELRRFVWGAA